MEAPRDETQPAEEDDQADDLTATERAFAEIDRRSKAMEQGMSHFGGR